MVYDYKKSIIENEIKIIELSDKIKGLENERKNIPVVDRDISADGAADLFDKLNG
jgi:hypothetical protein